MTEIKMCMGFAASTQSKCRQFISVTRRKAGLRTCKRHDAQEERLKTFTGDALDTEAIVAHHKRVMDTEEELSKSGRDCLEYLRPARFLSGKTRGHAHWTDFGDNLERANFKPAFDRKELVQKYGYGFSTAAKNATIGNIEKIGLIIAPFAALIAALGVTLYFSLLGFSVQPVAVEKNSLMTVGIGALMLGLVFVGTGKAFHFVKDSRRLALHEDRYKKVKQFAGDLERIKQSRVAHDAALDDVKRAAGFGESAGSVRTLIAALPEPQKDGIQTARRAIWSLLFSGVLDARRAAPGSGMSSDLQDQIKRSHDGQEPVSAKTLAEMTALGLSERRRRLQARLAIYEAADDSIKRLKSVKKTQDDIIGLNRSIATTEQALEALSADKAWFAASMGFVPFAIGGVGAFAVVVLWAWRVDYALATPNYCATDRWAGPRCFDLEVVRGRGDTSKVFEQVLFHGRVGDEILVTDLNCMSAKENDPEVEVSDAKDAKTRVCSAPAAAEDSTLATASLLQIAQTWWPKRNKDSTRRVFPAASVVALRSFDPKRSYDRLMRDTAPETPAPVYNFAQDNSFTTVNTSAQASGGPGPEDALVAKLHSDTQFVTKDNRVFTLNAPNEFKTVVAGPPQPRPFLGSVAKFWISVALPGASSQTPHFPEIQSGLKS